MQRLTRVLAILLAIALVLTLSVNALADFGDFSDGGDYGGGDYGGDYGGGYDSDNSSDHDSSSGGSGDALEAVVTLIVVTAFVIVIARLSKKKNGGNPAAQNARSADAAAQDALLLPVEQYLAIDPNFNRAETLEWASNLFVRMQNGWTAGDISDLRPYFTPAYFAQMEAQLAAKNKQGLVNYVERICVLGAELRGYYQTAGEDHMILDLSARFVDYTVEKGSGKIVAGDREQEIFLTYRWDLSRTSGVTTLTQTKDSAAHCPNCGASLDLNTSARCEYCGSVIEAARHDWAICRITKL